MGSSRKTSKRLFQNTVKKDHIRKRVVFFETFPREKLILNPVVLNLTFTVKSKPSVAFFMASRNHTGSQNEMRKQ